MAQRCANVEELGEFVRVMQMDFIISFFFTQKLKHFLFSLTAHEETLPPFKSWEADFFPS